MGHRGPPFQSWPSTLPQLSISPPFLTCGPTVLHSPLRSFTICGDPSLPHAILLLRAPQGQWL